MNIQNSEISGPYLLGPTSKGTQGKAVCGGGMGSPTFERSLLLFVGVRQEKGGSQEPVVPGPTSSSTKIQKSENSKSETGLLDCYDIIFVKVGGDI